MTSPSGRADAEGMSASGNGSLLVVSAQAGDFVWRAGGAIALAAERGDHPPVFFVEPHQHAGPNLGLPHNTMAEAFVRLYPEVTGVPA